MHTFHNKCQLKHKFLLFQDIFPSEAEGIKTWKKWDISCITEEKIAMSRLSVNCGMFDVTRSYPSVHGLPYFLFILHRIIQKCMYKILINFRFVTQKGSYNNLLFYATISLFAFFIIPIFLLHLLHCHKFFVEFLELCFLEKHDLVVNICRVFALQSCDI